jgi:hypothetical protein
VSLATIIGPGFSHKHGPTPGAPRACEEMMLPLS